MEAGGEAVPVKLKPQYRPVMLSNEGHATVSKARDLAMRLGLERLPPAVRLRFAARGITLTATVEAAADLLLATLEKEASK